MKKLIIIMVLLLTSIAAFGQTKVVLNPIKDVDGYVFTNKDLKGTYIHIEVDGGEGYVILQPDVVYSLMRITGIFQFDILYIVESKYYTDKLLYSNLNLADVCLPGSDTFEVNTGWSIDNNVLTIHSLNKSFKLSK